MKTASVFETKTNLSRYIAAILDKSEPYVVIVKNGKPVARLVPFETGAENRIGAGKDIIPKLGSLDEFNAIDTEIENAFLGNGGAL